MRVLADLFQPVEAETPAGGRSVSHEWLGAAWLALGRRRRAGRGPETVTAETRADPRLTIGRVLRFRGGDWSIRMAEPDDERPGRVMLALERTR